MEINQVISTSNQVNGDSMTRALFLNDFLYYSIFLVPF